MKNSDSLPYLAFYHNLIPGYKLRQGQPTASEPVSMFFDSLPQQ